MTHFRKRERWFWLPEEEAELLRRWPDADLPGRSPHAVGMHGLHMGLPRREPGRRAKEIFRGTDEDIAGTEELAEHKRIVEEARKTVQGELLGRAIKQGHE